MKLNNYTKKTSDHDATIINCFAEQNVIPVTPSDFHVRKQNKTENVQR